MSDDTKTTTRAGFMQRVAFLAACLCLHVGLALLLRSPNTRGLFYHLPYVAIVPAGLWWGWRSVSVAAAFVLVNLALLVGGRGVPAEAAIAGPLYAAVAMAVGLFSERTRAIQESLESSEAKNRLLITRSPIGIYVVRDDIITFTNPLFAEMLGYEPEELLGRSLWDLVADEDQPRARQLVEQRSTGGRRNLRYECRYRTSGGELLWFEVASSPFKYEGEPATLINVYNITEKKQEEEKRRELARRARKQEERLARTTRLAELGEMAGAIAHKLNQPLTGINLLARNAVYMVENQAGSIEDVTENMRLIAGQVDRASNIIHKMQDMVRQTEVEPADCDVNRILAESVEFLLPQLSVVGIDVHSELDAAVPPIQGDRLRLEQLFINLLTNARRAMAESERKRLDVRSRLEPQERLPVVVSISDTGRGFSSEEADKLFTPFYTNQEPEKTTGLGLSVASIIAREHGGSIEAEGRPGQGATFTIRLPIHGTEPATPETPEARDGAEPETE